MCPLCIVFNGIDSSEPRYIYVSNPLIPLLCRMRLDPRGSMNRAADYVLRAELRRTRQLSALPLLPPLVEPVNVELAPPPEIETILSELTTGTGTGTHLSSGEAEVLTLIARLIARHASFGFLFRSFDDLDLQLSLAWFAARRSENTPEMMRLRRNVLRALAGLSRVHHVPTMAHVLLLVTDTDELVEPIQTDGGRSVAAVADLLLASAGVGAFLNSELLPERIFRLVAALRELAAGPFGAAPGAIATAADALRLIEQARSERERERARKRLR